MATGEGMVARALDHVGEKYVNVLVPKDNANWRGPWDCAEFMSWLVFQEAGSLYGCTDHNAKPSQAEAYTGAWRDDSKTLGKRIPADKAAAIPGAFLLRFPPGPGKMGHIAISDGKGKTVEAMSPSKGVVKGRVDGRHWHTGVLVPGIEYDESVEALILDTPVKVVFMGGSNKPSVVKDIQRALKAKGINPGPIDGKYGPKTTAAVAAFQATLGLVTDGEVGLETAKALGVEI